MKISKGAILLGILLCGSAAQGMPGEQNGLKDAVVTTFTTMIGFPSVSQPAPVGTLLVPGTVIPLGSEAEMANESVQRDAVKRSLSTSRAVEKLWSTFRLDPERQLRETMIGGAPIGKTIVLTVPKGADVSISATLTGFNDKTASYRVLFKQGEKVLADSPVNVVRGGRAVVGGMNGEAAPYIFLFIEPELAGQGSMAAGNLQKTMGLTEPVPQRNTLPKYPESAKQEKVTGTVDLQLLIDATGQIQDIKVLSSPDPRLSESALAAAKQWNFEPARLNGKPVAAFVTISVRYALRHPAEW
jgi:TonB family protein